MNYLRDVFPNELPEGLPPEGALPHRIDLAPGTKPISKPLYRLSASEVAEVERQLADYLSKGFICKKFLTMSFAYSFGGEKRWIHAHVCGLSYLECGNN